MADITDMKEIAPLFEGREETMITSCLQGLRTVCGAGLVLECLRTRNIWLMRL